MLCYHGPLLYEAKCVKSRKDTKSGNPGDYQYFVHYQGWNKNWDEWVDETRILKASSENFDRKEKLFAQHQVSGALSVFYFVRGTCVQDAEFMYNIVNFFN